MSIIATPNSESDCGFCNGKHRIADVTLKNIEWFDSKDNVTICIIHQAGIREHLEKLEEKIINAFNLPEKAKKASS